MFNTKIIIEKRKSSISYTYFFHPAIYYLINQSAKQEKQIVKSYAK